MSKYNPLWEHVAKAPGPSLQMSFEEVEAAAGVPLDHSFLSYKKELAAYGRQVGKISGLPRPNTENFGGTYQL